MCPNDLVDQPCHTARELPGAFGPDILDQRLRATLARLIHDSPLSRDHIAERLTRFLGWQVRTARLDEWTAPSKTQYRIPALAIIGLCHALQTEQPLQVLAEALGGRVVFGADIDRVELARKQEELERTHAAVLRLRARIAERTSQASPIPTDPKE